MSKSSQRIRFFARPNGLGKRINKDQLPEAFMSACINADNMEQAMQRNSYPGEGTP